MTAQLDMFNQTTCGAMTAAISSLVSGCGITHSPSLNGPKTAAYGQEAAHASLSALPADKKAKRTIAIYGQNGCTSLKSASLQRCLESRLQARLPMGGLMMFMKGWKRKATPSGRLYCQLAVSAPRIEETGCGLWATPSTRDYKDTPGMKKKAINPDGSARSRTDQLGRQVFGQPAQTERKGSLNPEFPCWLMGIPTAWLSSMQQAMQSSHN